MSNGEKILMGIVELVDAKRLREKLSKMGIEVELGHNKKTCTRGCKVTVELWADPADVPRIQEVLGEERARLLSDLDVNPELENQVFDPDAKTAVCPACGTEFSTKLDECPECGLAFGVR